MIKHSLNLLVKLAIAVYVRLSPTKIERINKEWRPPADLRSILVFSNTALGDTLMSTPAIVSLKQSFPEAKLTLFVHRNMAPLFEGLEQVDEIVRYHGGFRKFLRTVLALRKVRPEAALLLHSNAPQDIPMAVLSGARIILKPPTTSEYKHYLSFQFARKSQHTIEDRLDLVRLIGGTKLTTRMRLPSRYSENRKDLLQDLRGKRVIGFQPGASIIGRMWPVENFAALADRLSEALNEIEIVITASRKEQHLAQKIIDLCATRHIRYVGIYDIRELPYLVREFSLLVTNDTGTMHLAIALGVPTLGLFGASSASLSGPYQDREIHRVIQKSHENLTGIPKKKRSSAFMRQITVDEVLKVATKMLNPKRVDDREHAE